MSSDESMSSGDCMGFRDCMWEEQCMSFADCSGRDRGRFTVCMREVYVNEAAGTWSAWATPYGD